jgi:hypothetical protein
MDSALHVRAAAWRATATARLVDTTAALQRWHESAWVGGATNREEPFLYVFRQLLALHCLHPPHAAPASDVTALSALAVLAALSLSPLVDDMARTVLRQYETGECDGDGGAATASTDDAFQPCFLLHRDGGGPGVELDAQL